MIDQLKWSDSARSLPAAFLKEPLGTAYLSHLSLMPKLDLANYEGGREPAGVKHSLLQDYLPELAYRIGRTWDSFAYVDGFAGPWKTNDPNHADSSFRVAIDALRRSQKGLSESHGRELHVT